MPLKPYACSNCGHWQKYFAPPPDCPVCTDTRNDLPHDGWHFRPAEEVRGMLRGHWRRLERDMVAFSTSPPFGLNGTGWLLLHPDGNVAFEAAPFYTDDMLAEIERLDPRFDGALHLVLVARIGVEHVPAALRLLVSLAGLAGPFGDQALLEGESTHDGVLLAGLRRLPYGTAAKMFCKTKSMPPRRSPSTIETAITTRVKFFVVSRSGQLTFFSSATVSR